MGHQQSSRTASQDGGSQWTAAAIAADPHGAFQKLRDLTQSRNAWHRKADLAEKHVKLLRRACVAAVGHLDGTTGEIDLLDVMQRVLAQTE